MKKTNNKKEFIHDQENQKIYDSFNEFIFSHDKKVFDKLVSKVFFLSKTIQIPGDILELGVFKGSGLVTWLKVLNAFKIENCKVVGFDFFNEIELIKNIKSSDKNLMKDLFEKRNFSSVNYENSLKKIISEAGYNNFELVVGDVKNTVPKYVSKYPGFRARLVNFDLDTEEPTEVCLTHLWDRLVPGGIFIFDEYAVREWTESNAVDKFLKKNNLQIHSTSFMFPSAYVTK